MNKFINYFILAAVIVVSLLSLILFHVHDTIYFWLVEEDGVLENITALALLGSALVFFLPCQSKKNGLRILANVLMGLVFFFGFGEEISWGQRIFDIESSEYFKENNKQGETNIHNLIVDGSNLNKVLFTRGLVAIGVIYLLFLPLLYDRLSWFKKLVDQWAVPLAKPLQVGAILITTVLVLLIDNHLKWEIWEFGLVLVVTAIVLFPKNLEAITNKF